MRTTRVPGEWEPQDKVIIAWDGAEHIRGLPTDPVHIAEVAALRGRVGIVVIAEHAEQLEQAQRALSSHGLSIEEIDFLHVPELSMNVYPRDIAPECVIESDGSVGFVDINCTVYGYASSEHPMSRAMEQVDRKLAAHLGIPEHAWTRVCSEGGAREFNGHGVMMAIEKTELQRNPGMSRDEIEAEFVRIFSVDKVVWLPYPAYEDEHVLLDPLIDVETGSSGYRSGSANGHIDEVCRFVSPSTILLAEVTEQEAAENPLHAINRARMEANLAALRTATDHDGNPFEIVRMPMPEPFYLEMTPEDEWHEIWQTVASLSGATTMFDGSQMPAGDMSILPAMSYCNYLVSNGTVLGQSYWAPGRDSRVQTKDEAARETLARLYPDREIVMIDSLALNVHGGGIHCNTRNIPAAQSPIVS